VIVLPKVVGNLVKGAIAIVESNGGVVDCLNVDTKEHHAIDLTGFEGWVFEPEYEIIPSLIELI
jgi:hypothetical protein